MMGGVLGVLGAVGVLLCLHFFGCALCCLITYCVCLSHVLESWWDGSKYMITATDMCHMHQKQSEQGSQQMLNDWAMHLQHFLCTGIELMPSYLQLCFDDLCIYIILILFVYYIIYTTHTYSIYHITIVI